jgi:hypothetical protein
LSEKEGLEQLRLASGSLGVIELSFVAFQDECELENIPELSPYHNVCSVEYSALLHEVPSLGFGLAASALKRF